MLRKNAVSLVLIGVLVLLMGLQTNLNGMIRLNNSEEAFDDTGTESNTLASERAIGVRGLVITGASAFLESHSAYLAFLQQFELSEIQTISTTQLNSLLDKSLKAMENAENIYYELMGKAERTPYNRDVYWRLICFDYTDFQYSRGLNRDVFSRVSYYLRYGDVRGCYRYNLSCCREILDTLYRVKELILSGNTRSVDEVWRLNQKYSEALLFGQYVAEVFYRVTGRG